MVDVAIASGRLLVAFFLVFLNGFFVAAEFAYVRIRSTAVEQLVEEGRPGADTLHVAVQNLDDYLAVTQLGITISSLGLGWVGEPAVAALIEPILEPVLPSNLIHLAAFALGFGFITFLHVVFGELAPKTIAIQRAERIALLVAPPMRLFYYLFLPGIVVFNGTANAFTKLVGVPPASETEETLEEEELRLVLARSSRQGHVDAEEVEMIERVFELDDTTVREIMVPAPDVVRVSPDLPLFDLRSVVREAGHTRYPIVDEEDDEQVLGFVDVKDVLWAIDVDAEEIGDGDAPVTAGDLARDLPVVPESGTIDDLLATFQRERVQIAAVIDEWGAFEGIATVEDVVEEVVGELWDRFDVDDGEPIVRRGSTYLVDGGVAISRVNDALDATFESDAFETIGGLVLDRLGRAPSVGDRVEVDGYRLEVDRVDGTRITRVAVREPSGEAADPSGETDGPTS